MTLMFIPSSEHILKKDGTLGGSKSYDFGIPKFGKSMDRPGFIGRRVDCIGRDIEAGEGENIAAILRRYLEQGKTITAKLLAKKAVVLFINCGEIIWP